MGSLIKPLGEIVVLRPYKTTETQIGGVLVPETRRQAPYAEVVAVGSAVPVDFLSEGDRVIYNPSGFVEAAPDPCLAEGQAGLLNGHYKYLLCKLVHIPDLEVEDAG